MEETWRARKNEQNWWIWPRNKRVIRGKKLHQRCCGYSGGFAPWRNNRCLNHLNVDETAYTSYLGNRHNRISSRRRQIDAGGNHLRFSLILAVILLLSATCASAQEGSSSSTESAALGQIVENVHFETTIGDSMRWDDSVLDGFALPAISSQPEFVSAVALRLANSNEPALFTALEYAEQAGTPGNGIGSSQSNQQPGPPKPGEEVETEPIPPQNRQPKRILGIMPNFRAVSAGVHAPPPTAKQAFIIATENSFDYSAFVFVGVTSALAEWSDTHPTFGEGMPGFGEYYWHGFADKVDGNYLTLFLFPTVLHEDERYYTMGKGGFWKRAGYAATRIFITPNYEGSNTFNASEVLGRGISQAISAAYYPAQTRTVGGITEKLGYAMGRDALTNVFREFWPDISVHVLHRTP